MIHDSHIQVICLESSAFYELIEAVVNRMILENPEREKWIGKECTKELLGIKSDTTLTRLRNTGKIRFSRVMNKIILYDRDSIEEYLNENAVDRF